MRADDRDAELTGPDGGFTLIELLVAMGLFIVLMSIIMLMVTSASRATQDTRQFTNINEQARIATERLSRELRQASQIRSVSLPPSAGGDLTVTFGVDFNGNGVIEDVVADPEVLTYRYQASTKRLTLTANDETGVAITRPILSEQVSAFDIQFRSSLWQYDANADGVTDWTELDAAAGVGNNNHVLDTPELAKIDLVSITLSVLEGPHQQTYQTQVSLRNLAQS
jgi:type II secretory pathway pseudopilin PulG